MATRKKTSKRARASAKRSTGSRSLLSALAAIQRATKRLGAKWYVFGAQALALHGVVRSTGDIDVTILADASTEEIVTVLRGEGIAAQFDDETFVQTTRVIPATHGPLRGCAASEVRAHRPAGD